MTGHQISFRSTTSPVSTYRRQPLLAGTIPSPASNNQTQQNKRKKSTSNVGEVAGGTTADIFVVCCCCPCVLFECLILAVYKVPANVVRRMWRKRKQKMLIKKEKKGFLEQAMAAGSGARHSHVVVQSSSEQEVGYFDELSDVTDWNWNWKEFEKVKVSIDGSAEAAVELDKQMWDRFRNAGFWRSPSQRFGLDE